MVIRPTLSSEVDGASCTALPANDGEERAMVEAAIVELKDKFGKLMGFFCGEGMSS